MYTRRLELIPYVMVQPNDGASRTENDSAIKAKPQHDRNEGQNKRIRIGVQGNLGDDCSNRRKEFILTLPECIGGIATMRSKEIIREGGKVKMIGYFHGMMYNVRVEKADQ